jgi:hypothetical protein
MVIVIRSLTPIDSSGGAPPCDEPGVAVGSGVAVAEGVMVGVFVTSGESSSPHAANVAPNAKTTMTHQRFTQPRLDQRDRHALIRIEHPCTS